jgi:DNA polymerase (family 10)
MAICDHAELLTGPGKRTTKRLFAYIAAIRKLNDRMKGIRLLAGVEVQITPDGALELADEVLAQFDFVIASIHGKTSQNRDALTRRTIAAINHPLVDAIGHLTGRLMGRQVPNDIDIEAVCHAAASSGTLLEINSQPARLDINDQGCRRGKELGVKFLINTDAHAAGQLDNMRLGVATARRGWLEKDNIANTRPLKQFLACLKSKKRAIVPA